METKGRGSLISSDNDGSLEISADELKSLYDDEERDFVVIDVREPEEFRDWKIQGSMNVPLAERFPSRVKAVANDSRVITVCRTGVRSLHAVYELRGAGLIAKSLRGGMVAWSNTYVASDLKISNSSLSKIIQIRRLSKGCTSYIIGHDNECIVVDPSTKIEEYEKVSAKEGFRITHVVDTHKHADHVSGARQLASSTGAVLHLSPKDDYHFGGFTSLTDKAHIRLENEELRVDAIHTPGHTPGSMSLLVSDSLLLSGDTLFLDGIGRPDLEGAPKVSAKQLYRTCQKIFDELNPTVRILPAHFGSGTDLMRKGALTAPISSVQAKITEMNFTDSRSIKALICNLPKPANYETILRINGGFDRVDPSIIDLLEEGHNRCAMPIEVR